MNLSKAAIRTKVVEEIASKVLAQFGIQKHMF